MSLILLSEVLRHQGTTRVSIISMVNLLGLDCSQSVMHCFLEELHETNDTKHWCFICRIVIVATFWTTAINITGNTRSLATYRASHQWICTVEVNACPLDLLSQLTVFRSLTSLFFFIRVCYVQRTNVVRQLLVRDRKIFFQLLEKKKIWKFIS